MHKDICQICNLCKEYSPYGLLTCMHNVQVGLTYLAVASRLVACVAVAI